MAAESSRHRFLQFSPVKPLVQEVNQLAAYILNRDTGEKRSVSFYRKHNRLTLNWEAEGKRHQTTFRFSDLVEDIRSTRTIDSAKFGLRPLLSEWLDASVGISKPDAPIVAVDGSHFLEFCVGLPFGDSFPLTPAIDREGVAFSSLQLQVQTNIVRSFKMLVDGDESPVDMDGNWLWDFRALLNECVSVVDMTLHQLYFMAQCRGQERGWTFEPAKLGDRHGRRLRDKLRWIGLITGQPLDDAEEEVKDFVALKDLRNHLNHFDPPCFAYTMEDLVGWLNKVPSVGRLLWRIREKLNTQLSPGVVQLILLPTVVFVPRDPLAPRVPQGPRVGYRSSIF